MSIDLLSKIFRRKRPASVLVSSDTPNGDVLVEFMDPGVWSAMRHDLDEEALSDLLWRFIVIWNGAVFESLGKPLPTAVAQFLTDQPALADIYLERKRLLFPDDHRLFADVKLIRGDDGDLQVHAVAVHTEVNDVVPGNTLAALVRRARSPKTRTDRNRDKRHRKK